MFPRGQEAYDNCVFNNLNVIDISNVNDKKWKSLVPKHFKTKNGFKNISW